MLLACPHCKNPVRAPDTAGGKRAECPGCKRPFTVPPFRPRVVEDVPVAELDLSPAIPPRRRQRPLGGFTRLLCPRCRALLRVSRARLADIRCPGCHCRFALLAWGRAGRVPGDYEGAPMPAARYDEPEDDDEEQELGDAAYSGGHQYAGKDDANDDKGGGGFWGGLFSGGGGGEKGDDSGGGSDKGGDSGGGGGDDGGGDD